MDKAERKRQLDALIAMGPDLDKPHIVASPDSVKYLRDVDHEGIPVYVSRLAQPGTVYIMSDDHFQEYVESEREFNRKLETQRPDR